MDMRIEIVSLDATTGTYSLDLDDGPSGADPGTIAGSRVVAVGAPADCVKYFLSSRHGVCHRFVVIGKTLGGRYRCYTTFWAFAIIGLLFVNRWPSLAVSAMR